MNVYDYYVTPEEYDIAMEKGIDPETVDRRIRSLGYSKERAINEPKRKLTDYKEYLPLLEESGIKRQTFYTRVYKGEEPYSAATRPTNKHQFNGVHEKCRRFPKEYLELAEQNGISYHTFRSRVLFSGYSLERASTEPIMSRSDSGKLGAQALVEREGRFHDRIFKPRND